MPLDPPGRVPLRVGRGGGMFVGWRGEEGGDGEPSPQRMVAGRIEPSRDTVEGWMAVETGLLQGQQHRV